MKTDHSGIKPPPGRILEKKILLTCGILSSVLYVFMNIAAANLYEGYSSVSQTISELSAFGAPSRTFWVPLVILYELLLTAFGWGVVKSAGKNSALRVVGILLMIFSLLGLAWPFASMHQREVLAAGRGSLADVFHLILRTDLRRVFPYLDSSACHPHVES